MTIKEIQEEIIDEFAMFDDWMERYEYLIDLGKSLPLIDSQYKVKENLISGCQSKVWLVTEKVDDNLKFYSDSDSAITKGISYLLSYVYSDEKQLIRIDYQDENGEVYNTEKKVVIRNVATKNQS